jgi:cytoskeletal protein RodZ
VGRKDHGEKGNDESVIAVARLGARGDSGQEIPSDAPQKKLSVRGWVAFFLLGLAVLIWVAYLATETPWWFNESSVSTSAAQVEPSAEDKSGGSTIGSEASRPKEYTYQGRQITLAPEMVFEITGKVESAQLGIDDTSRFVIHLHLKDNAKQALKEFSEKNINQQVGLTSRGKLVSVAVVQTSIPNGRLQISGGDSTREEMMKLASELSGK